MGNAKGVEVRNGQHKLRGVQARQVLVEDALPVQLEEQVAPIHEVQHQVQLARRLQSSPPTHHIKSLLVGTPKHAVCLGGSAVIQPVAQHSIRGKIQAVSGVKLTKGDSRRCITWKEQRRVTM